MNADAIRQYLETALWCGLDWSDETENNPTTLEDSGYTFDDVSAEAIESATADLVDFFAANAADIAASGKDDNQIAHDFFLTRNHHGAGFWDGDYPDAIGRRLTDAAHVYGEANLYAGDDRQLYFE